MCRILIAQVAFVFRFRRNSFHCSCYSYFNGSRCVVILFVSLSDVFKAGSLRDQPYPRNAHLKNFQHCFSISLQLQLSILLPYEAEVMYFLFSWSVLWHSKSAGSVFGRGSSPDPGRSPDPLVGWEGDNPSQTPSSRYLRRIDISSS